MSLARSAFVVGRRTAFSAPVRRSFTTSVVRCDSHGHEAASSTAQPPVSGKRNMDKTISEIRSEADLRPEGAKIGTVPTDEEQATGLERLEILAKQQGIDLFDMKPLPSDRIGTVEDPIRIRCLAEERYLGCTGSPSGSHDTRWLAITRDKPLGRCMECGSCYLMEYAGPDHVHHAERTQPAPKTLVDYMKPEYWYR